MTHVLCALRDGRRQLLVALTTAGVLSRGPCCSLGRSCLHCSSPRPQRPNSIFLQAFCSLVTTAPPSEGDGIYSTCMYTMYMLHFCLFSLTKITHYFLIVFNYVMKNDLETKRKIMVPLTSYFVAQTFEAITANR